MKKWLNALLCAFLVTFGTAVVTACEAPSSAPAPEDPGTTEQPGTSEACEHAWQVTQTTAATCTQKGSETSTCSLCGTTKTEETETDPDVHVHLSEWSPFRYATLEKGGEEERTCLDCSAYRETRDYSLVNDVTGGADEITLYSDENTYVFYAEYGENAVTVTMEADRALSSEALNLYYTAQGATELTAGKAWCASVFAGFDTVSLTAFGERDFTEAVKSPTVSAVSAYGGITVTVPYEAMGVTAETCNGKFAFFPVVTDTYSESSYTDNNAFVVKKYAETWLQLSGSDTIYYDTYYQNRSVSNWVKPSFADHDNMFVGVIKESTVEEAIIATAIAESKGAMGFDLHLNYLNNAAVLTQENLSRIFRSSAKPFLALFYDGVLTQAERLQGLKTAAEAGAAAVDMQGFMYWTGSTLNSQTETNVAYWEGLGYDMSFVSASPAETVLDPTAVSNQTAYVEEIHALGSEVLMSTHVSATFTADQAVAYAEFCANRGVDVVKIVGIGQSKVDVLQCAEACRRFGSSEKLEGVKVSFHLSGDASVYISRVICPVFYGSYVAFCYPELTDGQDANQLDLDMAIKCLEAREGTAAEISVDDAIAKLLALYEGETVHPQLQALVAAYNSSSSLVGYGYGKESTMGDRWVLSDTEYTMNLCTASGSSNTFNMRAFAYDFAEYGKELWFSTTVTASMSPYSAATRVPKVGVFIGTQTSMLAFVYNTAAKTVDLCYLKDYDFGFDASHMSDSLVSTGLITKQSYEANVAGGDAIRMAIHKSAEFVTLYFAVGDGELTQIAQLSVSELTDYFEYGNSACFAGALCEVYMGSASVGKDNWVKYSDLSYESILKEE